jgi:hypothetical protein
MPYLADLFRSALGLVDPLLIPRANRRLNASIAAAPDRFRGRLESAIDRAIAYFEPQREMEMSALYMLTRLYRIGLEPRLAFMETLIAANMARYNNPHWRYFDRSYDPWSEVAMTRQQQIPSHPIEALMLKCLYADRLGLGEDFLWQLASTDDGGSYGTTHIVAGGLALKAFSSIPAARIDAMVQATVPAMIQTQKISRAGDIFAERIMILQWLGHHGSIERAWIQRVLDAQNADGGWPGRVSLRRHVSNQHTACVALAALVQYHAFHYREIVSTDRFV